MGNNNTHCCNYYCDDPTYIDYVGSWNKTGVRIYSLDCSDICEPSIYELGNCGGETATVEVELECHCNGESCEDECVIPLTASFPYVQTTDCSLEFNGTSGSADCCGSAPNTGNTLDCGAECSGEDGGALCFSENTGDYTESDLNWYDSGMSIQADTGLYTYQSEKGCNEWRSALKRITLTQKSGEGVMFNFYFEGLGGAVPNRRYRSSFSWGGGTISDLVDSINLNNHKGIYTLGGETNGYFAPGLKFGAGYPNDDEIDLLTDSVPVYYTRKPSCGKTFTVQAEPAFCGCDDCECVHDGSTYPWSYSACHLDCGDFGSCSYKSGSHAILTDASQGMRWAWMTVTVSATITEEQASSLDGSSFTLSDGLGGSQAFTFDNSVQCSFAPLGVVGLDASWEFGVAGKVAGSIAHAISDAGWAVYSSLGGTGCGTIPVNREGKYQFYVRQEMQGSGPYKNQSSGNVDVTSNVPYVTFDGFSGGSDAVYDPCGIGTGWVLNACTNGVTSASFSWS